MYQLDLGKYQIILDSKQQIFKAERYGGEWRNLLGDNLILALVQKIQELEDLESQVEQALLYAPEHRDPAFNAGIKYALDVFQIWLRGKYPTERK